MVQRQGSSGRNIVTIYEVNGVTADGKEFTFEDHRVFELADGKAPLPVLIDRSGLTERIVSLRSGPDTVNRVGGATALWLALLGIAAGLGLSAVPVLMAWQTEARKQAKRDGQPLPGPDLGALAYVVVAAVLTIGGVFAFDLLR